MRILLVDDHRLFLDILFEVVKHQPEMSPSRAENIAEALYVISNNQPFDIIILDWNMPGMNGLEGLKKVLETSPQARVALLSGTAPHEVAEEALALGAAGFLSKSLGAQSIVSAIKIMASGTQRTSIDFTSVNYFSNSRPT